MHRRLGDDLYLSSCGTLPVSGPSGTSADTVVIIGIAVQTDPDRQDPLAALTSADADVEEACASWSGRWIVIKGDSIYTDAAGLLGCFYAFDNFSRVWISSSASIISSLSEVDAGGADSREITHGFGVEWYTPPASRYAKIHKLLPTRSLNARSGVTSARQVIRMKYRHLSYDAILERLMQLFSTTLTNALELTRSVWIPLTAGQDSRLLLAAAVFCDLPVRTVTQHYSLMSEADRSLPPQLAKAVGKSHLAVAENRFQKHLASEWDEHTAMHYREVDRFLYAREQFSYCDEGDLILRGGCFELGRCFYWDLFGESTQPTIEDWSTWFLEDQRGSAVRGLVDWFESIGTSPQPGLDWRDRFYWEQRMAGWLSSGEQGLDLVPAEKLHPVNCVDAFELLLAIDPGIRSTGRHQLDLVSRMAPELAAFPYNPSGSALEKLPALGALIRQCLRNPGYTRRLIRRKLSTFRD